MNNNSLLHDNNEEIVHISHIIDMQLLNREEKQKENTKYISNYTFYLIIFIVAIFHLIEIYYYGNLMCAMYLTSMLLFIKIKQRKN